GVGSLLPAGHHPQDATRTRLGGGGPCEAQSSRVFRVASVVVHHRRPVLVPNGWRRRWPGGGGRDGRGEGDGARLVWRPGGRGPDLRRRLADARRERGGR